MITKTKPNQKRKTGDAEESIKARRNKIKKKTRQPQRKMRKDSLMTIVPGA